MLYCLPTLAHNRKLPRADLSRPGEQAIEFLSSKIGLALLVLGAMHFFNLFVIAKRGRRAAEVVTAA